MGDLILVACLDGDVERFRNGAPQADDLTVVVARVV